MTGDLLQGFTLGEHRVYPATGTLSGPNGTHQVGPLAMDVLVHLAKRPGELITRQELIDAIWRLGSARAILKNAVRFRESEELENRISDLEFRLQEQQSLDDPLDELT